MIYRTIIGPKLWNSDNSLGKKSYNTGTFYIQEDII